MQIQRDAKQIHWAAKRGDIQAIERELERGVEVDARDTDGETPLMCAALGRQAGLSTLKLLVEAGADVNALPSLVQAFPLLLAAKSGRPEMVRYLLAQDAKAGLVSSMGYGALTNLPSQCSEGHMTCMDLLIEAGADLDARSPWDECAVRMALNSGNFTALGRLLAHGADRAPAEMTPLAWAVALGTVKDVELELDRGGDLSARDSWELTPWLLSLKTGDVAKAQLLLARGASFDDRGKCGETNLACAASSGHAEMVRWVLTQGASVDATDEFGHTALQSAAERGQAECARALLDAGASMELIDDNDRPEPLVASATNMATAEVFCEFGADINAVSGEGYWLLKTAAEDGDVELVRQLLAAGASVDHTSIGDTALHAAAASDELKVVSVLLEHGADPNAEDLDYDTPLSLAKTQECLDLLLAAGGKIRPEDKVSFKH